MEPWLKEYAKICDGAKEDVGVEIKVGKLQERKKNECQVHQEEHQWQFY